MTSSWLRFGGGALATILVSYRALAAVVLDEEAALVAGSR